MLLQDKIKQSIDLDSLPSVKRGFSRIWAAFQQASPTNKQQLLDIAEYLRSQLKGNSYEWKVALKRIDGLLELMRKTSK